MATIKRKAVASTTKRAKPYKVKWDGNTLTVVYGDPDGDVHLDTPDLSAICDLEDFVIPTKEEIEEAIADLVEC